MKDCPSSRQEREIEHPQHMLNLEEDQTSLLTDAQNGSEKSPRVSPLNLWMVGMVLSHSYTLIPK